MPINKARISPLKLSTQGEFKKSTVQPGRPDSTDGTSNTAAGDGHDVNAGADWNGPGRVITTD